MKIAKYLSLILAVLMVLACVLPIVSCDGQTLDSCAQGHVSGDWSVISEPTATAAGMKTKSCKHCSAVTEVETIAATGVEDPCKDGHLPDKWIVEQEATATNAGIQKKVCTRCKQITDLEIIPATDPYVDPCEDGHTPSSWTVIKPSTATAEGIQQKSCTVCGDILELDVISATDPYVDPCKNGHTPSEWSVVTAATATTEGVQKKVCTVCGDILEIAVISATEPYVDPCKNGHTPSEWTVIKAATATAEGIQQKSCTTCGEILELDIISATDPYVDLCKNGHAESEWSVVTAATATTEGVKKKICTVCGDILEIAMIPATDPYVDPCKNGHTPSAWKVVKAATATTEGIQQKSCTVCGDILELDVIPATDPYVDPCKNGHTPSEWKVIKAATATAEGIQQKSCTTCGEILELDIISATDPYVDLCKNGHAESEWSVVTAATATTEGVKKKICTVCGDILEIAMIPATDPYVDPCKNGHTPSAWKVVKAATATTEGIQQKSCTVCGDILELDVISATDPYVDPCKNGHTPSEWISDERPAVCFDVIKRKICTVCGDILDVGIDQGAGHLEWDDRRVVEGSCTTQARYEIYCEFCETTLFEFDDGFRHQAGEGVVVKQPTYQEEGLMEYRCVLCNALMHSQSLPKKEKYDQNGRELDDLPDDLNYGGEEITILHWNEDASLVEFEQAEITGNNVRDAVYDRNMQIEDRLNVTLKFIGVPAAYDGARTTFLKQIDAVYSAGTQDYDIIATYTRTQGTLAVRGYLENLAKIEDSYINFEKPWWPQQLVDTVSFGNGAYYFISGDMSTKMLWMMHLMYINKDMFSQLHIELPYQTVRDGKWTIDKLIEVTSGVYRDLDNDNTTSTRDRYGFVALHYVCDSFYAGSNMQYIEESDTNMLQISPDYTSKKMVELINKLGSWGSTEDVWLTQQGYCTSDEHMATWELFQDGQALIHMAHANYAQGRLLDADFEYGLVPNPKYDEKQVNYYTGMGNPWSLYGVYRDFDDRGDRQDTLKMFSAVLECWASEAYRLTTPEIFEVIMQLKYRQGQDETDMFEYIRSGIVFDLGKIFGFDLYTMSELASGAIVKNADWEELYPDYKVRIEYELAQLVTNFRTYNQGN